MQHLITATIERAGRLFGLDLFIEPAGSAWGLFDFGHECHGNGESEWWGLGLHLVVSPLTPAAA